MRLVSKQDLAILRSQGDGAALPAPKVRKNLESELQRSLVSWWHDYCKTVGVPEILLFSIPNGAAYGGTAEQRARRGAFMKAEGMKVGVPDLLLCVAKAPAVNLIGARWSHGLFLELKTPQGVLSPEQQIYHGVLRASGYKVNVCRTLEDAQRVIIDYLRT